MSHLSRALSRRRLFGLASAGIGGTLFAPFVSQLARARGASPRRFVLVVEGNGTEPVTMLAPSARAALDASLPAPVGDRRWWYDAYQHDQVLDVASADLDEARSLDGLGSLVHRSAVVLGLSSKISGGGHSNFHGALSCSKSVSAAPTAASIDTLLAAQVGANPPFDAVRIGVSQQEDNALQFGTLALGPGVPAATMVDPLVAHQVLFGAVADLEAFERRSALLDVARTDTKRVLGQFPSGDERLKLERYLESLEALSTRQSRLLGMASGLEEVSPDVPESSDDALARFDQQIDIGIAALLGGLTNVLVVTVGTGYRFNLSYPSLTDAPRHSLHHGSADSEAFREAIHDVTRHQVAGVARLANALASTPDVAGDDMLRNTVVMYLPETGEQHHSTASEWPALVIGGEAMGLVTGGRTLVYPGLSSTHHRQVSNLMNTLGHLAGLDLNDFGAETVTRMAEGPLSELLA